MKLLYSAGLLKDDISSFTVTFGLKAYKESVELEFIYSYMYKRTTKTFITYFVR